MFSKNTSVSDQLFESLKNDPRTKDAVIEIAFSQGILTLTGTVKSEQTRMAIEEIAKKQPGVVTVMNEVKVKPQ